MDMVPDGDAPRAETAHGPRSVRLPPLRHLRGPAAPASALTATLIPRCWPRATSEATLINGTTLAADVVSTVATAIKARTARGGSVPTLVVVLVGDNSASLSYIRRKEQAAAECGVAARVLRLSQDISQAELIAAVQELNAAAGVHGIIVQVCTLAFPISASG